MQEIFNVTRRYQNSVVKCQAQNIVGAGADSTTLDVICTYLISAQTSLVSPRLDTFKMKIINE